MRRLFPLALVAALAMPASVAGQGFAIEGHVGSTGLGGGVVIGVNQLLNVRGSIGIIPSDPSIEVNDLDWDLEIPNFYMATADFFLMGSGVRISGGGLFISNDGDLEVTGMLSEPFTFGDTEYQPEDVGQLTGSFSLEGFMPYAGIGFGNAVSSVIGLNLDMGVGFGKKPDVTLVASGPVANLPGFQEDLDAEIQDIRDDIPELLRFYPVLRLSLSIGFGN